MTITKQNPNQKVKISESFFQTEPLINSLKDSVPSIRLAGIKQLHGEKDKNIVNQLRNLLIDSDESVQIEARKKLNPIEMFYRRKFSFFHEMLQKSPDEPAYKLGFAVTCFRYSQVWVENRRLRDYFLRQALKYLNQLIRMFEAKSRYLYYRGKVLCELNEYRLAIEDFKIVLKQNSKHTGAILSLINLYLMVNKPASSYQLIKILNIKKLPKQIQTSIDFWLKDQ
jgi:predicted Zn-dependent protease